VLSQFFLKNEMQRKVGIPGSLGALPQIVHVQLEVRGSSSVFMMDVSRQGLRFSTPPSLNLDG
jgi:hypothetical protein